MTQFASALELATYLNGTTDLAELEDSWIAQANILLEMISADIEEAAGIPIEAGTGTAILAGTYERDIELPRGPIRDITAITVNGDAILAESYWWNERSTVRRGPRLGEEGDAIDYDVEGELGEQGAQYRDGSTWGGPSSTVVVAYSWGFTEVPDVIKSLTLRIAARTIGNVSDVSQESLAVYSVSYRSRGDESGSHLTLAERKRVRAMFLTNAGTVTARGR